MMERATRLLVLAAAISAGCALNDTSSEPASPVYSSDPKQAQDPADGTFPLQDLASDQVDAIVGSAWVVINQYRAQGVADFTGALKGKLAGSGKAAPLEGIGDDTVGVAKLPLSPFANGDGLPPKEYAKYFGCPVQAPESTLDDSCFDLVQPTLLEVQSKIDKSQGQVLKDVQLNYKALPLIGQSFVHSWAMAAYKYGAKVAAVYAQHELKAASHCDTHLTGIKVSHALGVEQGIVLLSGQPSTWAREQVAACVVNTDAIVTQASTMATAQIDDFLKQHPVCEGVDLSKLNQALLAAEKERRLGIAEGIGQQAEVLKQELFQLRAASSCEVMGECLQQPAANNFGQCWTDAPGNDFVRDQGGTHTFPGTIRHVNGFEVCCRMKDVEKCIGKTAAGGPVWCHAKSTAANACMSCGTYHLHVGSPLVIDIDGDGVALASRLVRFDLLADGTAQRLSWVGAREGLLALDLDGNGTIDTGAELFGDRSDCGARRCYDGVSALAVWDRRERGGNRDGFIDATDAVYTRLRIWVDANGDAVTQPGELRTLADHRVLAINLAAEYKAQRLPRATINSRLQVLTQDGFHDAYDVWFFMKLGPENLRTMVPGP